MIKERDIKKFWASIERKFVCSICGREERSYLDLPLWWHEIGDLILCPECYFEKKKGEKK